MLVGYEIFIANSYPTCANGIIIQLFWVLFGNNIQHFLIVVDLIQASNVFFFKLNVKVSLGKKEISL